MEPPTFADQPLRAQKRARTRVRVVEALHRELRGRTLEAVPVAALAEAAEISPATFFNYFPTKAHLLTHYIQLWSLRMGLLAKDIVAAHDSALAGIEALIVDTAEKTADNPAIMLEIIAHQARGPHPGVEDVELAERLLWLDDAPEASALSDRGLEGILPGLVDRAIATGELPRCTDPGTVLLMVASLFFGVPLLLGRRDPEAMAGALRTQLHLVWAGVRSQEIP